MFKQRRKEMSLDPIAHELVAGDQTKSPVFDPLESNRGEPLLERGRRAGPRVEERLEPRVLFNRRELHRGQKTSKIGVAFARGGKEPEGKQEGSAPTERPSGRRVPTGHEQAIHSLGITWVEVGGRQ